MIRRSVLLFLISAMLLGMTGCRAKEAEEPSVPADDAGAAAPAAPAAEVKTVSAEGVEMDYCVFGSGERSFVILPGVSIHSVMGSADAIAGAYAAFAETYTVYVFDPAKTIREGDGVRDFAEDTALAMQALGIKDADIFGASQGGMMALCLAIDHPELTHRIVLGSTLARQNDCFRKTVTEWKALAEQKDETALLECFADNVYSEATLEAYRDVIISSNQGVTDEEYRRFLIQTEACGAFDIYDELPGIKCPVLVLGCEGDKIITAEGSREIAEVLGCEIYLYGEEYGHGVYDEAPDYKDRLLDFFLSD